MFMPKIHLLILSFLIGSACLTESGATTIGSVDQAVSIARLYTGLGQWEDQFGSRIDTMSAPRITVKTSAALETLEDDRTPFFHDVIKNGDVWCVRFDSVQLGPNDTMRHNFVVVLEARSGALLSINGKSVIVDTTILPLAAPELTTEQLRKNGEVWEIADTASLLSLYDATTIGMQGCLWACRDFDAQLIKWTHLKKPPQFVWMVTLRGITPSSKYRGRVPDWQVNHERYIVDATTGKLLGITNTPMSESPAGDTAPSNK